MAGSKVARRTYSSDSASSVASDFEDHDNHRSPKRRRVDSESSEEETEPLATADESFFAPSRIRRDDALAQQSEPEGWEDPEAPPPVTSIQQDTTFSSLGVSPWLVASLSALQVRRPTAIQKACIPELLKGRDCIGGSRTGTGKTIAFAVPILQKWAEDPFGTYAVVLTPTRELALQIHEQFLALGAPQSLKSVLVTGGADLRTQALAIAQRPHIIIATPGRLADHIRTSGEDTMRGLSRVKVVVLDEADRLLTPGKGSMLTDVETCLSSLPPSSRRHTLLFTATVTPEVRALKSLPRPANRPPIFITEVSSNPTPGDPSSSAALIPSTLNQTYLLVPPTQKPAYLMTLLQTAQNCSMPSVLIFTNRASTADLLTRTFLKLDPPPFTLSTLHSQMPQAQRTENLSNFRSRKSRILIATDVASRGLDIPSVSLVINYDVPRDPATYVHRVGRTARAGREGTSITFIGQRDIELILGIEEYTTSKMTEWEEEGVNVETRVVKGNVLKHVGEARVEAMREIEQGIDMKGKRKMKKFRVDG
ncbi:putative atp-dependent rna helicase dbp8 [Phaeomoniella chlamydospora]|uniref:RNA helicase n=1 Tax=Phaeomoniella chlamydospora TaxID=158046 RepID=A0A0G2G7T3_PHACM|nr:putative atp-dependent rna helicase dbp8 [Phaeomoniella chlamydospora]